MKIGVMQPYFMPYIGYWQLMNAVDKHVVFDDVNYIVRGWINRNRILINNEPHYINLPVCGASQNKLINEVMVNNDSKAISSCIKTIELAYKRAPFFHEIFPIIEKMFELKGRTVSEFILNSFYLVNEYLGIKTELILSSSIEKDNSLRGEEKILEICRLLNATDYYNAIGGQELYDREHFSSEGLRLSFLKTDDIEYKQYGNSFIPDLSIIDVLMFNCADNVRKMLDKYTLV